VSRALKVIRVIAWKYLAARCDAAPAFHIGSLRRLRDDDEEEEEDEEDHSVFMGTGRLSLSSASVCLSDATSNAHRLAVSTKPADLWSPGRHPHSAADPQCTWRVWYLGGGPRELAAVPNLPWPPSLPPSLPVCFGDS